MSAHPLRLAVDIGGTFTDVALDAPKGRVTAKVLTTPQAPERGVMHGLAAALSKAGVGLNEIDLVVHGTTLATNALIERKGALTALITTAGFRDTVEIGYEHRFEQYDVNLDKPQPLVPRRLRYTVPERVDARGAVLCPLDESAVRALVPLLQADGVRGVAVALLHSYANPAHERRIRDLLLEALPGLYVSLSAEVSPELREYERFSTACANAYVQPLMAGYLDRLDRALRDDGFAGELLMMTSGGGVIGLQAARRFPVRLVESGPAAGAILTSRVALQCGVSRALSFDMGGTTAKICLIDDGEPQAARTFEVARAYRFLKGSGLPLRIPVIEMVEIGAGGGSIARVDALKRMTVGPDSAGAVPGPACYGRGGDQATVTDADLLLGRIEPTAFAAGIALDVQAAAMAVRNAGAALELDGPLAALAISETVDENMASAARVHAVERGKSLEERTLIAFGGAAPLHAARLAEKLGIQRIVVPAAAGVGSAVGMLDAPVAYEIARSLYQRVTTLNPDAVNLHLRAMRQEAHEVVARSAGNAPLAETCTAYMRFIGQGHEIAVPLEARPLESADREHLQRAFEREYRAQFGRAIPNLEAEVLSWAIAVRARVEAPARDSFGSGQSADVPCAIGERALCDPHSGHPVPAQVFRREALAPGARIDGPALVVEDETSVVVPAGFTAIATRFGHLVLERVATQPQEAQA